MYEIPSLFGTSRNERVSNPNIRGLGNQAVRINRLIHGQMA